MADGGALSQEDLDAYRVVETAPRRVAVDRLHRARPGRRPRRRAADHGHGRPARCPATRSPTRPRRAALVQALRAPDKRAETTNIVAVDRQGDGCVITTSLGLGSGVWVDGYGVHLNSMIGEGELVRELVEPGQRMGSMMSPLVALDEPGQLAAIAGAAGGSRIRPALVQCVLRILRGEDPQAAIDAPRLNALPDLVRLEPGFSAGGGRSAGGRRHRSRWPTTSTTTSAACPPSARSAAGPTPAAAAT